MFGSRFIFFQRLCTFMHLQCQRFSLSFWPPQIVFFSMSNPPTKPEAQVGRTWTKCWDNNCSLSMDFLWDQVLLWNLLKHAGCRVLLHVEPYSVPCFSDFFVIFVLQLENCHTWDCESSCSGCLLILMAIFGSLGVGLGWANLFLCSTVAIHSAAEVSTGTPQVDPDGFRRAMVSW
jgi:hypothetical protein